MFASGTKEGVAPVTADPRREGYVSWKEIIEPIEPFMDRVAHRLAEQVDAFDPEIAGYARYALTNQGKQLRPALVALSGAAGGKVNEHHVTVAVIIEMVHLATLVHDDIMDEAEIRRRRPTLAANWGKQISVLLGDCLFAHALQLAAGFPTTEVCRAVASATNTVCSGEILQTHHRWKYHLKRADYFKVLEMKTAELFALSCELGASIAGAGVASRNALRDYGLALGTAYQIYDDCVDVFGSEAAVGKSLGTDLAGGKLTLPVLVILEKGSPTDQAELKRVVQSWDAGNYPALLRLLETYGARQESSVIIHRYIETARRTLFSVPDGAGRVALGGVADFLARQTDLLGVSC